MAERVPGSMASRVTSALLGKHGLRGYIVFGKRARFPSTFCSVLQMLLASEKEKPALLWHGNALPIALLGPL